VPRRPIRRDHRSPAGDGRRLSRGVGPAVGRGERGLNLDAAATHDAVDRLFREEQGRAVATLIRVLGDFDLAEEAVQDAFIAALEVWPDRGIPANPGAWITTTARNRAIDRIRRRRRLRDKTEELARDAAIEADLAAIEPGTGSDDDMSIADDRLRLIFTCCHPALPMDGRVALTLRTLGGLTTPEIARAFLVPEPTLAQRLVRAKRKIRDAGIPYRVPPREVLPERLGGVLKVLYLVYNEGYSASSGDALVRRELSSEAIRLARIVVSLLPDEPEVLGLLALMLLHDARREARVDATGDLVLLEDQDRSRWDAGRISEGRALVERAMAMRRPGPYQIQAAIAALHDEAESWSRTDWRQIVELYRGLIAVEPSPVVELNLGVAVAMAEGPAVGLAVIDGVAADGSLDGYPYLHAARADLLRRLERWSESAEAYRRALDLTTNRTERTFLKGRLAALSDTVEGRGRLT
jgi:RNA polymerase sigma-70 factor (ECF subfamily)